MLSIAKAAELLDVSKSTVRRLIASGQLRAIKIGGQVRIRLMDLVAFINGAS
jgi:excisionase family DNA binding protein